jgi:hypothetical protein
MSDAANEALPAVGSAEAEAEATPAAERPEAGGTEPSGTPALVESDHRETVIPYDPSGRMPRLVMAMWVVALVSLAAYTVVYLLPDLARWGRP